MKTGAAIVELLQAYGVEIIFGIPGTHSIELYRSLSTSPIQHILPRHEQGAGFMADGYARVSGNPGVCFVITGPGVTNIATAMAQAMSDSIPMLVISPVNDPTEKEGDNLGRLHELTDQSAATKPFTVLSQTAESVQDIPHLIGRAFSIFHSERPGPVHISIPLTLLRGEIESPWQTELIDLPPGIDQIAMSALVAELQSAESPVIVAGGGCRHFGELVVSLAEKLAWPVTTTVAGRGVVPGTHPLSLGAQFAATPVQRFIADSDLVLVLGSELAEPDHWADQLELPDRQIWINLDLALLQRQHDALTVHADVRAFIPELLGQIAPASPDRQRMSYQKCKQLRDTLRSDFSPIQKSHWRVLTELKKSLPHDVCVFSDMTQLAYTAVEHMPWHQTNAWMHPNGYGTLGYALPAAMGACFHDKTRPALVIVGDAGFQYTLPELAVAAEHQLNIVVLLWQNNALLQIANDMEDAGFTPMATTQPNPDFIELAKVYGWNGSKLAGLFELSAAIETAFASSGPVLLELDQGLV